LYIAATNYNQYRDENMRAQLSFALLTKSVARTLLVALLGLTSPLSYAGGGPRHIAIDFGYSTPTTGTNDSNGEAWEINPGTCDPLDQDGSSAVGCVLDFSSTKAAATSSGPVSLGFDVNLNGVTYKQVHVNQNGVVTFVTALGTYAPVTDFASLETVVGDGNPFIAAFYPSTTALDIPLAENPADMGFNGGAEYGRGLANPTGTDVGTSPDIDGDVLAFKATWIECPADSSNPNCATSPTNPVQARIVLYNRYDGTSATTDGDFDLRFEYNSVYDTGTGAGGQYGVVGFRLGSVANTVNLSGSSTAPTAVPGLTDIYYQFRKGVLVGAVTAVTVPNVVNDTLAAATTAITAVGLVVGTTSTQSSTTVASGSVISQDPAAGASAPSGSAVNLVLSSGPPLVTVPNVVNDTLATATGALTTADLVVGTTTKKTSPTVPAGSVISQDPAAGAKIVAGSAVNLVVSTGGLRGDVNQDGQVDILDLIVILEGFGKKVGPGDPRDLNGDGVINLKDAAILVSLCTNEGCAIHGHHRD
jgi:PASTA domain/Dockerin type I domain